MGFFSDLKEDLSQAVNDLRTDEMQEKVSKQEPMENMTQEPEEIEDTESSVDLEKMLENIDSFPWQDKQEIPTASGAEVVGMMAGLLGPEEVSDLADVIASTFAEDAFGEENAAEVESYTIPHSPSVEVPIAKRTNEADSKHAVITSTMTVAGDVTVEGDLTVAGSVNGRVVVSGQLDIYGMITGDCIANEINAEGAKINGEVVCEGAVKIGKASVVIGNVEASGAVIAGAVKGDIDVKGPVIIESTAIVVGNVKSKSVQIDNGAWIEGMCSQCYADVSPSAFFDDYKPDNRKDK